MKGIKNILISLMMFVVVWSVIDRYLIRNDNGFYSIIYVLENKDERIMVQFNDWKHIFVVGDKVTIKGKGRNMDVIRVK